MTEQAAEQFARIAQILRRYGHDPHEIAHFLIRLLFCLFAEDVGILPAGLFTRLVHSPRQNAAAFAAQLRQLFAAMADGGFFGVETIPHVDGGLFNDDCVLPMDTRQPAHPGGGVRGRTGRPSSRRSSARCSSAAWTRRSGRSSARTSPSKEDILLVVEPVLMAPLRRRVGARCRS